MREAYPILLAALGAVGAAAATVAGFLAVVHSRQSGYSVLAAVLAGASAVLLISGYYAAYPERGWFGGSQ